MFICILYVDFRRFHSIFHSPPTLSSISRLIPDYALHSPRALPPPPTPDGCFLSKGGNCSAFCYRYSTGNDAVSGRTHSACASGRSRYSLPVSSASLWPGS